MAPMRPDDPAYWMLLDSYTTTPVVYDPNCYICRDPEFAQMGLPLCRKCPKCRENPGVEGDGHIPADDTVCTVCGFNELAYYLEKQSEAIQRAEDEGHLYDPDNARWEDDGGPAL